MLTTIENQYIVIITYNILIYNNIIINKKNIYIYLFI